MTAANPLLPWHSDLPLMLAPMQGLTNRAMRSLFVEWVRPDTVFTEFIRAKGVGAKPLSNVDLREATSGDGVPLVVQLIGHGTETLTAAAEAAQGAGAVHLNLNVGCPYGRMTTGLTGGGMLREPQALSAIVPALRRAVSGTFSVKIRAGYDDPRQIFALLPLLEGEGVDFLVLHPRTVVQEYGGSADHGITAEVVAKTTMPVIANGDIRTAADGLRVLRETGAAGLMLGRGAIADPLLFRRLRGEAPAEPDRGERARLLRDYLRRVLENYRPLFCGNAQLLSKVKGVLATMDDPDLARELKRLRKAQTLAAFEELLATLA